MAETIWYTQCECPTCVVEPLFFVRNERDGLLAVYCTSCGAIYTAPDGVDFAYGGDSGPDDTSGLRAATLAEVEEAGFHARIVDGPARFP